MTITAAPDKGYVLESLTVLDKDGKALELTDKGGGKYIFVMPAGKTTVKAVFMDDNTMLNFFTDVHAEDYYYDAVLWAAQKGITGGIGNGLFGPHNNCTRAQIVTFLSDCTAAISKSTDGKRRQGNTPAAVCLPIFCRYLTLWSELHSRTNRCNKSGKIGKMSYFRPICGNVS